MLSTEGGSYAAVTEGLGCAIQCAFLEDEGSGLHGMY